MARAVPILKNVRTLSPLSSVLVSLPNGVRLRTDTAAAIEAAAPPIVGDLVMANDTGDIYLGDSDNNYHPLRSKAYAGELTLTFPLTTGSPQKANITGSLAYSNRLQISGADDTLLIPAIFGVCIATINYSFGGTAPTGVTFYASKNGATTDDAWKHHVANPGSSGAFTIDLNALPGSNDDGFATDAASIWAYLPSGAAPSSFTAKIALVTVGTSFIHQNS